MRSSPYVLLPPWQIRRIYNGILHAEVWKLLARPLRTAGLRQAFGVTAVHTGLDVLLGGDGGGDVGIYSVEKHVFLSF